MPPPSCTWEVLGNLTVDQAYEFHVQACKSSQGGECVNSTAVTITVEAGKLPEITILPQLAPKANPAEVLRLEASARGPVTGLEPSPPPRLLARCVPPSQAPDSTGR